MMRARKRVSWALLGLFAGGCAVSGQTRETLACVARLELPPYSPLARAAQIQGRIDASFTVAREGAPENIIVSGTNELLRRWVEERLLAKSTFRKDCTGEKLALRVVFILAPPRTRLDYCEITLVAPNIIEVRSKLPELTTEGASSDSGISSP